MPSSSGSQSRAGIRKRATSSNSKQTGKAMIHQKGYVFFRLRKCRNGCWKENLAWIRSGRHSIQHTRNIAFTAHSASKVYIDDIRRAKQECWIGKQMTMGIRCIAQIFFCACLVQRTSRLSHWTNSALGLGSDCRTVKLKFNDIEILDNFWFFSC